MSRAELLELAAVVACLLGMGAVGGLIAWGWWLR